MSRSTVMDVVSLMIHRVPEGDVHHTSGSANSPSSTGRHVATIRVTEVVISRFADVPDRFALAEAEGDLNAADFHASHTAFWASVGTPVTEDMLIVQLYFELDGNAAL